MLGSWETDLSFRSESSLNKPSFVCDVEVADGDKRSSSSSAFGRWEVRHTRFLKRSVRRESGRQFSRDPTHVWQHLEWRK